MILSVSYGAVPVAYHNVINAIKNVGLEEYETLVVATRIPRVVFGVISGAALSISGVMMQAITRNPIADPSILGVNTGASLFVVCGMAFFHISSSYEYIWLAFIGAALTAVLVYGLAALAGVLLCASTTALAGPIGFVGLMVPHLVRAIVGPDLKKVIPLSALLGACLLLIADLIGRIFGRPGEIESGIITAFLGAPVFILIIRKVKVQSL